METIYIYAIIDEAFPEQIRYVGKTINTINERFNRHLYNTKQGIKRPIYLWLNKLLNNGGTPKVILLEETNELEWESREIYWIQYYRNLPNSKLLNLSDGGGSNLNWSPTAETRRRISESNKGKQGHWKGKKLSEEHKANIALGGTGLKRSQATCENIAKGLTGKKLSDEHKSSISKAKVGKPALNIRSVLKLDLQNFQVLAEYNSLEEAVNQNQGISKGNLVNVCKGKRKSAGGYSWKYKEN